MKPGEIISNNKTIEINQDSEIVNIDVINSGDRPIQVGSHYHFFEANRYLRFSRETAFGCRLNIPSGTAVRFEPGEKKEVEFYFLPYRGSKKSVVLVLLTAPVGLSLRIKAWRITICRVLDKKYLSRRGF